MILIAVGMGLAFAAAVGGLTLVALRLSRRRPPRALLLAHPAAGAAALVCLWVTFALWRGPRDLPLDAGTLVLSLAFAGGGFLLSLRLTRLPRPFFVVGLHALVALLACALLVIGWLHLPAAG